MKIQAFVLVSVATLIGMAVGCSDPDPGTTTSASSSSGSTSSSSSSGAGGGGGSSSSSSGSMAMMPTLGKQIDRMGRPAINTAANNTFEADSNKAGIAKNAYNEAGDPAQWTSFSTEISRNLAILDSLDTVCGNQLLADAAKNDPSRYAMLSGVLADDRLYVNLAGAMCTTYLGVEANAVGVANMDCGGRTLAYDVIDASYTALATGKLDGSVGDDVPISVSAEGTQFPYLAAPH